MMTVETSFVQIALLGALLMVAVFLFALLCFGVYWTRKAVRGVSAFQKFGIERVDGGRIQLSGMFTEHNSIAPELQALPMPSIAPKAKSILRQALDFSPSPEDQAHIDRVEGSATKPTNGAAS